MAEPNIVAQDLMLRHFERIRADVPLGTALRTLAHVRTDKTVPNVVAAVAADGRFEGLLTARLLIKSLLSLWMPSREVRADPAALERELLALVRDRADRTVHDALIRGLPVAAPGDRLIALIDAACEHRLEFVAVVEDGYALGVVPVTAIFQATARLVLTPEHEGIRFDED